MIISIVYSITFLLMVTAAFGCLSFPMKPVSNEFKGSRQVVDARVNAQPFAVKAAEPFILAQESKGKEALLKMVVIRARSSIEVKQLRRTHIDIVRVRPDPERPPGEKSISGGFIVEAVVTADQLHKLEAMGFEVSEISREK